MALLGGAYVGTIRSLGRLPVERSGCFSDSVEGVDAWQEEIDGLVGHDSRRADPARPTSLSLVLLEAWHNFLFDSWNPWVRTPRRSSGRLTRNSPAQMSQVENVAGFLFSPDRGPLVWTPIVLVGSERWRCESPLWWGRSTSP